MLTDNVLDLIGNTPLIRLKGENVYAKAELLNPGGSIKDRVALAMIEAFAMTKSPVFKQSAQRAIDFIHKDILGAWVVWLLILGHVLAALYHHFIRGDRTLRKMTSGK